MTPQEISDAKMKWRPGVAVYIHTDIKDRAFKLIKELMEPHQWDFKRHVAPYTHQLVFEKDEFAMAFRRAAGRAGIGQWVYNEPQQ